MPAPNLRGGLLPLSLRDGKLRLRLAKPLPDVSREHEAGPGKEGVPDSTQVDKADVGEGWTVRAAEIAQASRQAGGAGTSREGPLHGKWGEPAGESGGGGGGVRLTSSNFPSDGDGVHPSPTQQTFHWSPTACQGRGGAAGAWGQRNKGEAQVPVLRQQTTGGLYVHLQGRRLPEHGRGVPGPHFPPGSDPTEAQRIPGPRFIPDQSLGQGFWGQTDCNPGYSTCQNLLSCVCTAGRGASPVKMSHGQGNERCNVAWRAQELARRCDSLPHDRQPPGDSAPGSPNTTDGSRPTAPAPSTPAAPTSQPEGLELKAASWFLTCTQRASPLWCPARHPPPSGCRGLTSPSREVGVRSGRWFHTAGCQQGSRPAVCLLLPALPRGGQWPFPWPVPPRVLTAPRASRWGNPGTLLMSTPLRQ